MVTVLVVVGMPTCLVTTAGGGGLGWMLVGEDLPKVQFPVARAMMTCAKNA